MHDAATVRRAPLSARRPSTLRAAARAISRARADLLLALLSAILLILSFPDFNLWPLAWVALTPLMLALARRREQPLTAFFCGWLTGTLFFYLTCYWLTYSMIRYGNIPAVISYALLIPGAIILGVFPALFSLMLSHLIKRFGTRALFIAPPLWPSLEWARLGVTGQLWNAIAYSQAFHPSLIQAARWGSVYAVGFLILMVNAALAYFIIERNRRALIISSSALALIAAIIALSNFQSRTQSREEFAEPSAIVIAVQPNVPMEPTHTLAEYQALVTRHLSLTETALRELDGKNEYANLLRVVVWPESPMLFTYARDSEFRALISDFARRNRASVLFNSQEPVPASGSYNSAVMVSEGGKLVAQYDKIRLLPFGEYVPLPRWLPGANLIPTMVGDFVPGAEYTLMPLGEARTGVFICFESAFPNLAREFAKSGADVLINISNDGYLGQTPVMHQHLANTVFRAAENGRPILRVTNTGITARISERGEVMDETAGFQTAVRIWTVSRNLQGQTFYTRHGDLFVNICATLSLVALMLSFGPRKRPL